MGAAWERAKYHSRTEVETTDAAAMKGPFSEEQADGYTKENQPRHMMDRTMLRPRCRRGEISSYPEVVTFGLRRHAWWLGNPLFHSFMKVAIKAPKERWCVDPSSDAATRGIKAAVSPSSPCVSPFSSILLRQT